MNSSFNKKDFEHIQGWGIDADPENDPTYPMKTYTGDDHKRIYYQRPPLQKVHIEVLHSNERPGLSAVVGTSSPPSGLSGMLRRYAFKYSEGSWAHWLPLIFADRVNMIEGIFNDIGHGHVPNFYKERGGKAAWKYNRKKFVQRTILRVAVVSAIAAFIIYRIRKSQ